MVLVAHHPQARPVLPLDLLELPLPLVPHTLRPQGLPTFSTLFGTNLIYLATTQHNSRRNAMRWNIEVSVAVFLTPSFVL